MILDIWLSVRSVLTLPVDDPELARSQMIAFTRQMPLLYGILLINAVALAVTHAATAPVMLTLTVPTLLCAICMVRIVYWYQIDRSEITAAQAIRQLKYTSRLAPILGACFTGWALSLYPYGDAFAQCHVAFYMSITVISCIFCLMHLRSAALLVSTVVIVPFTIFFCATGNLVFIAIALNFLIVACGMIFILLRNYNGFSALIVSQRDLLNNQRALQTKQLETQILSDDNFRLANLDILTKLPNRRHFMTALERVLTWRDAPGAVYALGLLDLDGFKGVNDEFGHRAGDELLTEVARRLQSVAGPTVTLARLGGDEFGILLSPQHPEVDLIAFAGRLCALLREPYHVPNLITGVSGSTGWVSFHACGALTAGQLLEQADYALYHAKGSRTGEAVMFSHEHEKIIRERSRLEQALRHADLDHEMRLAFQPIVDADSRRTIAFESLARWTNPALGRVSPTVFIPLAERTRMVGRITRTLLARTLDVASAWPEHYRVSFNLSAQDLTSPDTIDAIRDIVTKSRFAASRIDFEITETAVLQDFGQAAEALDMLGKLGARIALDDFGIGFSSLSYVHRLKVHKIKIDRSFVLDIHESKTSQNIVRTIVAMCRNLDLDCIVEGVETEAQMHVLQTLGCTVMQGFLFGPPIAETEVAGYIEDIAKSSFRGGPSPVWQSNLGQQQTQVIG